MVIKLQFHKGIFNFIILKTLGWHGHCSDSSPCLASSSPWSFNDRSLPSCRALYAQHWWQWDIAGTECCCFFFISLAVLYAKVTLNSVYVIFIARGVILLKLSNQCTHNIWVSKLRVTNILLACIFKFESIDSFYFVRSTKDFSNRIWYSSPAENQLRSTHVPALPATLGTISKMALKSAGTSVSTP